MILYASKIAEREYNAAGRLSYELSCCYILFTIEGGQVRRTAFFCCVFFCVALVQTEFPVVLISNKFFSFGVIAQLIEGGKQGIRTPRSKAEMSNSDIHARI